MFFITSISWFSFTSFMQTRLTRFMATSR